MVTRPEFRETAIELTGQSDTATSLPAFREHFDAVDPLGAVHITAKAQELDDLHKGMRGDDDVLMGGRMRRGGARGQDGVSGGNGSRTSRLIDDLVFQQMMNDLQELADINAELETIRQDTMKLAEKYLNEETQQRRPGESDEEFYLRIKEELQKVRDAGGMSAEDALNFDARLAREAELNRNKYEIEAGIKEKDLQYGLSQALVNRHRELLDTLQSLDTKTQHNHKSLSQLDRLKKTGDTSGSNAELIVMLDSRPDLGIKFPEDANFEEKIEMIETAVNEQNIDLQREQVEAEEEIEAAQETLSQMTGLEQSQELASNLGDANLAKNHEEVVKESGMTFDFSLVSDGEEAPLSLASADETPLDNKLESSSTKNTETETPVRDLTKNDQMFS